MHISGILLDICTSVFYIPAKEQRASSFMFVNNLRICIIIFKNESK
jgi:hypothetical protein